MDLEILKRGKSKFDNSISITAYKLPGREHSPYPYVLVRTDHENNSGETRTTWNLFSLFDESDRVRFDLMTRGMNDEPESS